MYGLTMGGTALTKGIYLEHSSVVTTGGAVGANEGQLLGSILFLNSKAGQCDQPEFTICSEKFDMDYTENWLVNENVTTGQTRLIDYSQGSNFLIGSTSVRYTDIQTFNRDVTERYRDIFDCIESQGYKTLARVWNFIPSIHIKDGIDRYQHFCQARHNAFESHYNDMKAALPAATAVGIEGEWLHLYFIASKLPVSFCENARQISAYEYPLQYGPKSPSFARASLIQQETPLLLISGTASVVGHKSLHINDVAAQTRETLDNLQALIQDTDQQYGTQFGDLTSLRNVKVYIRYIEHKILISGLLDKLLPEHVDRVFIVADICREELLVEIEAVASDQLAGDMT